MPIASRGPGKKRYLVFSGGDGSIHSGTSPLGVMRTQRYLTSGNLWRYWDLIDKMLHQRLDLADVEVIVIKRLLQFWSYYGLVYPKASQIAREPSDEEISISMRTRMEYGEELPFNYKPKRSYGCARRTFWRTVNKLQDLNLIEVVNRYIIREHAQISNLYILDNLIIVIARYLAEHGKGKFPKWILRFMRLQAEYFWSFRWASTGRDPPHVEYA